MSDFVAEEEFNSIRATANVQVTLPGQEDAVLDVLTNKRLEVVVSFRQACLTEPVPD